MKCVLVSVPIPSYSIPLFKYPHFRIVFLGPSMTLLFRDRPKSHFGLSETQVAPEISWLISCSQTWPTHVTHQKPSHPFCHGTLSHAPALTPNHNASPRKVQWTAWTSCGRNGAGGWTWPLHTHWPLLFVQHVIQKPDKMVTNVRTIFW